MNLESQPAEPQPLALTPIAPTGAGDASFTLSGTPVAPETLVIQLFQGTQAPATWTQVA